MIASIKTPSNAVEFHIDTFDLRKVTSEVEQIEALDWILLCANAGESPVPDDVFTIGDEDGERLNTLDWRGIENAVDVVLLADEGCLTELEMLVLIQGKTRDEHTGKPSRDRMESETSV